MISTKLGIYGQSTEVIKVWTPSTWWVRKDIKKLNQGSARCRRAFAKQGVRPWKDTHRVKYSQPEGAGPRCPECLLHQSFHAQATCSRSLKYTGEEFYGSTTPQPIATKSSKITIIKGRPSRTREACYSSTRTQEGTCRPTFFSHRNIYAPPVRPINKSWQDDYCQAANSTAASSTVAYTQTVTLCPSQRW